MGNYNLSNRNLEKKSGKPLLSGRNFFIALAVVSSFLIFHYHAKSDFNQTGQPKDSRGLSFESGPKLKRGHSLTAAKPLTVKKIDF
ncbi:MAG: hypothetical protein OEZ36_05150, partial [Spirochaetota bacterium]|nr:hypothetical protein [Spirochaetota bacterium]